MVDTGVRLSFRERSRQLREEEIIREARTLIAECGYHETSMDEVAERVGISKATLYQHFPSKEELALTVIGRQMDQFIEYVQAALHGDGTPGARLCGVMRRLVLVRHGPEGAHLGPETFQAHQLFKNRPDFAERFERLNNSVAALVEQGKASGEIDPALPTQVVVSSLFGLVITGGHRLYLAGGARVDELAEHLVTIFCRGLRPASQGNLELRAFAG